MPLLGQQRWPPPDHSLSPDQPVARFPPPPVVAPEDRQVRWSRAASLPACLLGRECLDLPASVCLEEAEWDVLTAKYTGAVPNEPPKLVDAVIWLGRLGGYIARPKDYLPGVTTIWRGQRASAQSSRRAGAGL